MFQNSLVFFLSRKDASATPTPEWLNVGQEVTLAVLWVPNVIHKMGNYAAITLHVSKIMVTLPEYASNHVAKMETVVRTKIISSDPSSDLKPNLDHDSKSKNKKEALESPSASLIKKKKLPRSTLKTC